MYDKAQEDHACTITLLSVVGLHKVSGVQVCCHKWQTGIIFMQVHRFYCTQILADMLTLMLFSFLNNKQHLKKIKDTKQCCLKTNH